MNKKMTLWSVVTSIIIAAGLVFSTIQVTADAAVLKKSDRSRVINLISNTTNFASYEVSYNMKKGSKKTYDFAKSADREKVIRIPSEKYLGSDNFPYSSQKSMSLDLFGTSTTEVSDPVIGDWGETVPSYVGYKYSKQKNGLYKVTASISWMDYFEGKRTRRGKVTFIIKRQSSSRYGFVLMKMTIRR